jgi:hypothetical protein
MYGLPVGQGSIDAALKAGIVTIAPLDLAVADGRLKAWPRVVLSNDPMLFQLAQGTSLEKVQITPGMCQSWLKYVAPLLADATRAEGKFSLHLDGASLPVLSPAQGEARGTLGIHTARVGPGPLAETYVVLAEQVRAIVERKPLDPSFRATDVQWLTLPEQNVPVHMTGGRIHHRGLTMAVNTTTVVSSGSVGADQTLALVLEVPIKDQWIASEKLLAGLRGQSIKIPISGTFAQPKVDRRALDQLAAQLLGNAATGLLQQELEKGLDKLLRPRN